MKCRGHCARPQRKVRKELSHTISTCLFSESTLGSCHEEVTTSEPRLWRFISLWIILHWIHSSLHVSAMSACTHICSCFWGVLEVQPRQESLPVPRSAGWQVTGAAVRACYESLHNSAASWQEGMPAEQESQPCTDELISWSRPGEVCCEMQKKPTNHLVSWDKGLCLRGKANEIMSMTQDLVRMFRIYWAYSVLSRYFPLVPVVYINHSDCTWIPCSLRANCKSLASSQLGSVGTEFQSSFLHSPTTSRNLLTSFSKNLKVKHAAGVANPQMQKLHFRNDWCAWVGLSPPQPLLFFFFFFPLPR